MKPPVNLQQGRKYVIRHRSPMQRKMRESVMKYLGDHSVGGEPGASWSARPVAGTQPIPWSWVYSLSEADEDAAIRVNDTPAGNRLA